MSMPNQPLGLPAHPQIDPALETLNHDFISAVVAAASSTSSDSELPISEVNVARAPEPVVNELEEHISAHQLAHKWMTPKELKDLQAQGIEIAKGKFSLTEEAQLDDAIEKYRIDNSLSHEAIHEIIFGVERNSIENEFWTEIASAVPCRPLRAVYHFLRRKLHPLSHQGKWMPEEDDLLREAVAKHGKKWELLSEQIQRTASDCRDRYRNHIEGASLRITGRWSRGEELELEQIVLDMIEEGKKVQDDLFWGNVAGRMQNKRTKQQCRNKWASYKKKNTTRPTEAKHQGFFEANMSPASFSVL